MKPRPVPPAAGVEHAGAIDQRGGDVGLAALVGRGFDVPRLPVERPAAKAIIADGHEQGLGRKTGFFSAGGAVRPPSTARDGSEKGGT